MTKDKVKKVYKDFRSNLQTTIAFGAFIAVILIVYYLVFFLVQLINFSSFYFSYILQALMIFIAIWLLGLLEPFIYSYYANNGGLKGDEAGQINLGSFVRTYSIGKRPPFRGRLQVYKYFFFALLVFLAIRILSSIIVIIVGQFEGNEIHTLIQEVMSLDFTSETSYDSLDDILNNHKHILQIIEVHTTFAAMLPAFYFFVNRICMNTLKYPLAQVMPQIPPQLMNIVFKEAKKDNRKFIYGNYYRTAYPLTIAFIVIFSGSYYLLYFLLPNVQSVLLLAFGAIVIDLFIMLIFMPIIFNTHEIMYKEFYPMFLEKFISLCERDLENYINQYSSIEGYDPNVIKRAKENIESLRKQLETAKASKDEEVQIVVKDPEDEN